MTVNGAAGTPSRKLRRRRRRRLDAARRRVATEIEAEAIPLTVVHEDRWLVVIDKPAGLVVHPAPGHEAGTLVNALLAHCRDLRGIGGELRPGIVHRIDKDTSGLLVVAKDDATMAALGAAFKAHTVERVYDALVAGKPPGPGGRIDTLYGRDPHERKKFSSRVRAGKRAVTNWRVVERFPGAARIEARLETGRTHQVRVHMAALGCPLLADKTYGRPPRDAGRARHRRGARAAGAARAHARVRSPGDRQAAVVRVGAAARHAGGAGGAARARLAGDGACAGSRTIAASGVGRAAAAPVAADRGAVRARVLDARGRRQRGAVRHAQPGRALGRRHGDASRRTGAGCCARSASRGRSTSRARSTAQPSCACAPGDDPAAIARIEADALITDEPGRAAGRVRRRLHPGADRRSAHRRGRRRARRLARHGRGRAARGGARARRASSARGPATCASCWGRRSARAASRWAPRSSRRSRRRWAASPMRGRRCRAPSPRGVAGKWHVDLKAANRLLLARAGVRARRDRRRRPTAPAATARASSPTAATATRPVS